MSYYPPGYGYDVDALTRSFGSFGMSAPAPGYAPVAPAPSYGMSAPGYYMPPAAPRHFMPRAAPAMPRVRFEAVFKKGNGQEVKPLDIHGVIRMLDMPPAALSMIVAMCDFPNGDTIEIHVIYTHKGRREAGAYQFHVVAMYHYNKMNRPYAKNPNGSVHMQANGTPDSIDSIFFKLPDTAAHNSGYALSVLYNLLGGYLMHDEKTIVERRVGREYVAMPGLLEQATHLRRMGGSGKRRGRSMTRKGKGKKRRLTRRSVRR
jgi:hypothetical protein